MWVGIPSTMTLKRKKNCKGGCYNSRAREKKQYPRAGSNVTVRQRSAAQRSGRKTISNRKSEISNRNAISGIEF
jgi:hypothetical protein